MRLFEWMMRCVDTRHAGDKSEQSRRRHTARAPASKPQLTVVCHQANLQKVRRRIHAALVAADIEIEHAKVIPMAEHTDLFNIRFAVTCPPHQRKILMEQLSMFASDTSIQRIHFGRVSCSEPRAV